jgi:predicted alpha/beta-fold hydrolase
MTIENSGIVPFKDGEAYLVNILKTHSVINFSNQERKHLIVHGIVGNRKSDYCKLLANSYRRDYDKIQSKIRQ